MDHGHMYLQLSPVPICFEGHDFHGSGTLWTIHPEIQGMEQPWKTPKNDICDMISGMVRVPQIQQFLPSSKLT